MRDHADGAPLAIGLIGAGAIAQTYLKAFETLPGARLAAIADTRSDAARAAGESAGCPAFTAFDELSQAVAIDAVIICTPPSTHRDIAVHFLERGVPVLCEKPLSVDVESARAMVAAASRHRTLLTMASKFRYVDDLVRVRALVASGALGEIVAIENSFSGKVDMAPRWNSDRALSGGGVIIDNGTHSVDIIRFLVGPIAEIFATSGRRLQPLEVEDSATLNVRTASGATGTIDLTWSLDKGRDTFVDIYGSQGVAHIGWRESRFRRSGAPDWTMLGKGYDKIGAFQRKVTNFCAAIRDEEPLLVSAADALASVQVIRAAYDSLATGRWVAVEDDSAALTR